MRQLRGEAAVLVRYLARLDGRDKMLRLLQYGSRLCMWSAEASSSLGAKDPGAQWYKKSYKGISLHRKAFRLFKWAQEYHAACEFMDDAKLSPVKRRLNVLNKAALAAYLVNDNINWAIGLKLTQAAPDRFKAWAYRARCTAAVCQAVLIWMKWRALRRERAALTGGALRSEEQRAEDRAALAALKRKEWELTLKTAKVLGDVVARSKGFGHGLLLQILCKTLSLLYVAGLGGLVATCQENERSTRARAS